MRRKNVTNEIIKESLTEALIQLMKKQDFKDITITELTKRAGVGRVSFYRNFESKEDILVKELDKLAMIWSEEFEKEENPDIIIGIFSHFLKHKELIQLLYSSNLSHLLMKNIYNCCGPKHDQDNASAYFNAWLAGSIFASIDEWVNRGMQETPEQMRILFQIKLKTISI